MHDAGTHKVVRVGIDAVQNPSTKAHQLQTHVKQHSVMATATDGAKTFQAGLQLCAQIPMLQPRRSTGCGTKK